MISIDRIINMDLPVGQSAFLWGARKTGKSTLLKMRFPNSIVYDFLKTDLLFELTKRPALIREQLLARTPEELQHPVILDEVQKVPHLLDEVHWLIENKGIGFILCGSSARKLRRGHANLLGGRAWRFHMHPLTTRELPDLDLLRALNFGLIPAHYLQTHGRRNLKAYVSDYLKEEVFDEGLTRNIPAFSRFFEAMGYSHGQLTNYANIARECGVDAKTVREYYQILIDTLLGMLLPPFKRRQSRQVIGKASKFYLFDVGVAGFLSGRKVESERGEMFGHAFEHFILMELVAQRSYLELEHKLAFWRTKSGLEVDFVLGDGQVAIEVKGTQSVQSRDLRPLRAFMDEYSPAKAIVVCNESQARRVGEIDILPWREFLNRLWNGSIIT
jgi:predicted AAA+ superfamily ATPase